MLTMIDEQPSATCEGASIFSDRTHASIDRPRFPPSRRRARQLPLGSQSPESLTPSPSPSPSLGGTSVRSAPRTRGLASRRARPPGSDPPAPHRKYVAVPTHVALPSAVDRLDVTRARAGTDRKNQKGGHGHHHPRPTAASCTVYLTLRLRAILYAFQMRSMEPRREAVLRELGEAWDEVGEAEEDRRAALRALEEDCLAVYAAKVAQVRHHAARLRAEVDAARAELAALRAAIGQDDPRNAVRSSGSGRSLREELRVIASELDGMRQRRDERRRELAEVAGLIDRLHQEMRPAERPPHVEGDDGDLTMMRLQELRAHLRHLQSEKENRIKKMAELRSSVRASSAVLGMGPAETGADGEISDGALERLESEAERLREAKRGRMQRLQDLVVAMLELWSLMDTPAEEQSRFQGVACNVAASEEEITEPGALSAAAIGEVEAEVARLEGLKGRRMKDLLARKRGELREIRRRARIVPAAGAAAGEEEDEGEEMLVLDDNREGAAQRTLVLARLDAQILEARDEEFSRKEVLERMERWQAALEEESWLEEYNRNENRYNVGKGTHLVLKHAEKARSLVSKMSAMAKALTAKVVAWEKERGAKFVYDGEGLLDMLQEYDNTRKEKEQERKRHRDQRRLQGQGTVESPVARSLPKTVKNVTRTLSMGGSKKMVVSSSSSSLSSSRPTTPSYLKSTLSQRRSDDEMSPDSFE